MSLERENEIAHRRHMQPAYELQRKAEKARRRSLQETQEAKDVWAHRAMTRHGWCGDTSGGPWGPIDS